MRNPAFLLCVLMVTACASIDRQAPLTGAEIVILARNGKTATEIIEELKRTQTVLPLQASDFVRLHDEGVPDAVLDYLQLVLINEIRWQDRALMYGGYGPFYRGMGPCPLPYRRGQWGC